MDAFGITVQTEIEKGATLPFLREEAFDFRELRRVIGKFQDKLLPAAPSECVGGALVKRGDASVEVAGPKRACSGHGEVGARLVGTVIAAFRRDAHVRSFKTWT